MAMALGRSLGKWRVAACTQEEARKRAQLELSHRIEQDTLKRTLTTKIEQHQSDALQIRLEAQAKGTERRKDRSSASLLYSWRVAIGIALKKVLRFTIHDY